MVREIAFFMVATLCVVARPIIGEHSERSINVFWT